jgi:hypothetical protein
MNITLDNQTFPVRANMRAWRNYERETGNKVASIDAEDVTAMPELLYYFVQEGCKRQGMKFEMPVDEFLGLIEMPVDEFLGLIEVGDLPKVVEIIEQSMGGEKKTKTTDSKAHLNGTK